MPKEKKKMLILAILGILRNGTDADHRIRQAEIISRLNEQYHLTATRKSVRKNLGDLQEAGYPVVFRKGWFYDHEFSASELNFLMDSVLGSDIPAAQREVLLEKLTKLGGSFYSPSIGSGAARPANPQYLYTLETVHAAITEGVQLSFRYGDYDVDKELHPRLDEEGKPKLYKVNPYRVATANGRCYLICNVDKYSTLCHFRVDRILDIRKLKAEAKPLEKVADATDSLESEQYILEHPYMYSGKPKKTKIIVQRNHINDVLDWFGTQVQLSELSDTEALAVLTAEPTSVDFWLRRYGEYARPAD